MEMKKKKIIIIAVSIALAVCIGVGCYHFFTYRYYSPEAKIIKGLLTGFKTNLEGRGKRGYEVSFRQEYEIESRSETDEINVSYVGEGSVMLSYDPVGESGDSRLADFIASENGYISGVQNETFKCYNKEDREGDADDRIDDVEYSLEHEFTLKTDGGELYAASDSKYTDFKDEKNSCDDTFSGKIDKEVLLGSVSEERIGKAMTRLLFMDAWEYIRQFGDLSEKYLEELDFSNAKAVRDFMSEKEITVDDRGDTVYVTFVLDSAQIVADITDKDAEHLPKIYGSMELDKETGDVLYFEYNFGQYLLASLMKSGEGVPSYKAEVKDFTVEGRILGKELEDLTLEREFVEYTDEDKFEFINAFSEHIIPFYEEEG